TEYGDSIVKLKLEGVGANRHFEVQDFFTPHNQAFLNSKDLDLGSAGVLLIPDWPGSQLPRAVAGGKQGYLYLMDRNSMGKFTKDKDSCLYSFLASVSTKETRAAARSDPKADSEGRPRVKTSKALKTEAKDVAGQPAHEPEYSNIHTAPVFLQTAKGPY